jgi:hypothetical protein
MRLGAYLTLLRGILYERDYVEWCDQAAALLREAADEPAAAGMSRQGARKPRE